MRHHTRTRGAFSTFPRAARLIDATRHRPITLDQACRETGLDRRLLVRLVRERWPHLFRLLPSSTRPRRIAYLPHPPRPPRPIVPAQRQPACSHCGLAIPLQAFGMDSTLAHDCPGCGKSTLVRVRPDGYLNLPRLPPSAPDAAPAVAPAAPSETPKPRPNRQGQCRCGHSAYLHRDRSPWNLCIELACPCPGFLLEPGRDGYGVSNRMLAPVRTARNRTLHAIVDLLRKRPLLSLTIYQALAVPQIQGRRLLMQLNRRGRLRLTRTPAGFECHLKRGPPAAAPARPPPLSPHIKPGPPPGQD